MNGEAKGVCHRIIRVMVDVYNLKSRQELDWPD